MISVCILITPQTVCLERSMFSGFNSNVSVSFSDLSPEMSAGLRGVYLFVLRKGTDWEVAPMVEFTAQECKFISPCPVGINSQVSFLFALPRANLIHTVDGVIHWCRKVRESWHVGAMLNGPLEPVFSEAMGEDNRSQLRYEVNRAVRLRASDTGYEYPATLLDYSMSGASFRVNGQTSRLKGRLVDLIPVQESEPIACGKVVWSVPCDRHSHFIGASITDDDQPWFFSADSTAPVCTTVKQAPESQEPDEEPSF